MIEIPEIGFRKSSKKSNVCPISLGDWLEGIILFDDSEHKVSKSDVVDLLMDNYICPEGKQDLARKIADDGWNELKSRKLLGGLPNSFEIYNERLVNLSDWSNHPIHSFLLLLSLFKIYPDWAKDNNYHKDKGTLFEEVVETLCSGWELYTIVKIFS